MPFRPLESTIFAARRGLDRTVRRIIGLQVALTALVALALLGYQGASAAFSALLGGSIGFLTSLVYAKTMLMVKGEEPKELLKAHIRAEACKLASALVLFIAVFAVFENISPLVLLLTFAATLAAYWAGLLMIETRPGS
jgi:ATP synthase protein I